MKKVTTKIVLAFLSVMLFSCMSNSTSTEEQEGIQIDPELKELGELNALLFQHDDAGEKYGDCVAVKSKKKWGLINLRGDTIIEFKYDKIERNGEYWYIEVKNDKGKMVDQHDVGIADAKGKIILNAIKGNRYCAPLNDGLFEVHDNDGIPHLYNNDGKEIFVASDDEYGYDFPICKIQKINDRSFMVSNNFAWFRMTYNKGGNPELKIDSIDYYDVKCSSADFCFVKNEDDKWGAINDIGETIVPFEYNDAKFIRNDNGILQNSEGNWVMFDGKQISPFHDNYYTTIEDYSICIDGDGYVVLDKKGKELFGAKDLVNNNFYSDGMFIGKHCLYDSKGNAVITINDSLSVVDYLNGYIVVCGSESQLMGVLDKNGKIVVPITYRMRPHTDKDSKLILLTRCERDEVINGERVVVLLTDIFNTKDGKLTKTKYYINKYVDGLALAEVEGRHVYVNVDGKTGILNMEVCLKMLAEKQEQNKQQEQEANLENIKQQLVETINKENGREVLSGTYSIHDLTKNEDGTYRAEFYDFGVYETFTYEISNITIDDNNKVTDFGLKVIMIRPTDKKPDGGIKTVEEIVKHQIGAVGY